MYALMAKGEGLAVYHKRTVVRLLHQWSLYGFANELTFSPLTTSLVFVF